MATVPTPSVVLQRTPSSATLYGGTQVDFTCTIEPSDVDLVSINITVSTTWNGPNGTLVSGGRFTLLSPVLRNGLYASSLSITSLQTSDTGAYTCTAVVRPDPVSTPYIATSMSSSSQSEIDIGEKRFIHSDKGFK